MRTSSPVQYVEGRTVGSGNGVDDGAYPLAKTVALHLLPGAVLTAFILVVSPVLTSWGIDTTFALFGGIGLVLVPVEFGYLTFYAHRSTGSWSPWRAVDLKERLPRRTVVLLGTGLAIWFLVVLAVSVSLTEGWLTNNVFSWVPDTLRQFAATNEGGSIQGGELIALLVVALAFNAILGPVTEEMYFRGHLLPRLDKYGSWAPIISTALFALYHFFSPWRYLAIFVGFLPITWVAWRKRSVFVSMLAHVLINTVTVMLLFAALAATPD